MKLDANVNAAMKGVTTATITGAVNGIAHAVNGDYKKAAEEMAYVFLEYTFPPTRYIKLGVDLINYSVTSWNDYALQLALEKLENKGYTSISADEWATETTTGSIVSYLNTVRIDALKSYCGITGIPESQLSDSEKENIRSQAERDVKRIIEERLTAKAQLKQKEAEYLDIIQHFKDDDLLDFFDFDMTTEFRLNRLFMVRKTILDIVGGPLIHPLRTPEECLRDATYYYVRIFVYEWGGKKMIPGGQQEFIDWLISEGYIKEEGGETELVWELFSTSYEGGTGGAPNPNDWRFNYSTTYTSAGLSFTGTYTYLDSVYVGANGIITILPEHHSCPPDGCTCSLIPGETYTANCTFNFSVPRIIRNADILNLSVYITANEIHSTHNYIPAMTASIRSSWSSLSYPILSQINPRAGRLEVSRSVSGQLSGPTSEGEEASIVLGFGSTSASSQATTTFIYKAVFRNK